MPDSNPSRGPIRLTDYSDIAHLNFSLDSCPAMVDYLSITELPKNSIFTEEQAREIMEGVKTLSMGCTVETPTVVLDSVANMVDDDGGTQDQPSSQNGLPMNRHERRKLAALKRKSR